jgi:hypothetical protein
LPRRAWMYDFTDTNVAHDRTRVLQAHPNDGTLDAASRRRETRQKRER